MVRTRAWPRRTPRARYPIVMVSITDPVGTGLVASYARPGANITRLSNVSGELGGKLLELLKEVEPKLTRAAILRPAARGAANDLFIKKTEVPARALGNTTSLRNGWGIGRFRGSISNDHQRTGQRSSHASPGVCLFCWSVEAGC